MREGLAIAFEALSIEELLIGSSCATTIASTRTFDRVARSRHDQAYTDLYWGNRRVGFGSVAADMAMLSKCAERSKRLDAKVHLAATKMQKMWQFGNDRGSCGRMVPMQV